MEVDLAQDQGGPAQAQIFDGGRASFAVTNPMVSLFPLVYHKNSAQYKSFVLLEAKLEWPNSPEGKPG